MTLSIELKLPADTDENYKQNDILVDDDDDVMLICRDTRRGDEGLRAVALNTGEIFDLEDIVGKVRRIRATLTET